MRSLKFITAILLSGVIILSGCKSGEEYEIELSYTYDCFNDSRDGAQVVRDSTDKECFTIAGTSNESKQVTKWEESYKITEVDIKDDGRY